VSDSAKLSIMSKNEGIEPVVMAFKRGIVIVGAVACAVKGKAAPLRMSLRSLAVVDCSDARTAYDCVKVKPEPLPNTKSLYTISQCRALSSIFNHLLKASTTIKTTLSN